MKLTYTTSCYITPPDQGGRSLPFSAGYRPHIQINEHKDLVPVTVTDVSDIIGPNQSCVVVFQLDYVDLPLKEGDSIRIIEGPRLVAHGTIDHINC